MLSHVSVGHADHDVFVFLVCLGVLIMDRKRRVCYMALSQRANKKVNFNMHLACLNPKGGSVNVNDRRLQRPGQRG